MNVLKSNVGNSLVSVLVATVLISGSIAGFVSTLLINKAQQIQIAEQVSANHLILELIELIHFIGSNHYPSHKFNEISASDCPNTEQVWLTIISETDSAGIANHIKTYIACKLWHIHPNTKFTFTGNRIQFTCSNQSTCVSMPFNNDF